MAMTDAARAAASAVPGAAGRTAGAPKHSARPDAAAHRRERSRPAALAHSLATAKDVPSEPASASASSLSDTDAALPVSPGHAAHDHAGSGAGSGSAGSGLAAAKLSTKKKEALSQVPCKFFRSNGCSAGASCPFSHTLPGEGAQKATCQWFLKGNCRFGHKCALAHIFPGQPISMDRKNKRAVQHGQPLPQSAAEAAAQAAQAPPRTSGSTGANLPSRPPGPASNVGTANSDSGPAELTPVPSPRLSHARLDSGKNSAGGKQGGSGVHSLPVRPNTEEWQEGSRWRPGDELYELQEEASTTTPVGNGGSGAVPVPMPVPGPRGAASRRVDSGSYSHSLRLGGVGSPGSAFGTSPFTNNAVFYSESQGRDEEAKITALANAASRPGPFAERRGSMLAPGSLRSHRLDLNDVDELSLGLDLDDLAEGTGTLDLNPRRVRQSALDDDDDADEGHEEDFLPSSLSDLLTPQELERRSRSSRFGAQSLPSNTGAAITHGFSVPSHTNPSDVPSFLSSGPARSALPPATGRDPMRSQHSAFPSRVSALSLTRSRLDATPEQGVLPRPTPGVGLSRERVGSYPGKSHHVGLSTSAHTLAPATDGHAHGMAFPPDLAPIAPGSVLPPRQFGFAAMLDATGPSGSLGEVGSAPRELDVPAPGRNGRNEGLFPPMPMRMPQAPQHGMGMGMGMGMRHPPGSGRPLSLGAGSGAGLVSPSGLGPVNAPHLPRADEDDAIFLLE